jgi:hypothetical protein
MVARADGNTAQDRRRAKGKKTRMSMWRWRKVRYAQITPDRRTEFERYGELVLAHALATSSPVTPPAAELAQILLPDYRRELLAWLTERRDIAERKAN